MPNYCSCCDNVLTFSEVAASFCPVCDAPIHVTWRPGASSNFLAAERPVAITVCCILGFIGAITSIPLALTESSLELGSWYPVLQICSNLLLGIAMTGLWYMKRWSVYLYVALTVFTLSILVTLAGPGMLAGAILPMIWIAVMLRYFHRMN